MPSAPCTALVPSSILVVILSALDSGVSNMTVPKAVLVNPSGTSLLSSFLDELLDVDFPNVPVVVPPDVDFPEDELDEDEPPDDELEDDEMEDAILE